MKLKLFTVDAFTDKPFAGNPAAVCVMDEPLDEATMRLVAREMNLSETAFLERQGDVFRLRWFTPNVEVDLCGHATLASAHVLWEKGYIDPNQPIAFATRSGRLSAVSSGHMIELNFPAVVAAPTEVPAGLESALGEKILWCGLNSMDYLVEIQDETRLRNLKPDLMMIANLPVRGVIVTCQSSSSGFDFISRFFAPAAGVPEDPVTGSAHCALAPYWRSKLGKDELRAYQASERGGIVAASVQGDRVLLRGQSVTMASIELEF